MLNIFKIEQGFLTFGKNDSMWQTYVIIEISIPQLHHKPASELFNYRKESNQPNKLKELAS